MTKSLAQEVASRGVTVNAIAPGFIETAMTDALTDKQKESILARVPAGRLGEPDDIAAGALYLASNEGAYVTGQTLHINGGMAMISRFVTRAALALDGGAGMLVKPIEVW
jgi:3-oxoacyl-[acyl-carrier protein] reductase